MRQIEAGANVCATYNVVFAQSEKRKQSVAAPRQPVIGSCYVSNRLRARGMYRVAIIALSVVVIDGRGSARTE